MKKKVLSILIKFFIITTLTALLLPAQIILKGFVPHDINEAVILYEYKKICNILAPDDRIDMSPITVSFYSKKIAEKKSFSLPEWGGGGAIGKNSIIVHIDKKPFLNHSIYQTTVHELVHIAINRMCDNFSVPRWFHEGLAMFLSGEVSERENIVISRALFIGSLMPLNAIDSVNRFGKFRAELAYCQSRQVVRYLVETYGMDVIPEIIQASNKTGSFWKGYYEVLRVSETELESYYRKFIMEYHGRFFWLVDSYLIWSGIVLLFLAAYVVTLIRIRKKKRLMEASEIAEEEAENG